ncbi:MAG: FtsQ-type POTRA domain-containing protein [Candidatus Thioglobus sp.]|nr:FtsQ-type POTRA domain-containing protein [Candidatus Thioglobus sp.]
MPMLKILALILTLGLIIFGLLKSNQADFLKVDIRWEIDKNLPVGQALLASKIQPLITGKYQLDLQDIKSVLELEPWVQTAHINRLFWNTLKIKITPQTVAMRWENVNCKSKKSTLCKGYISTKGELFLPQKFIKSDAILALSKWDENLAKKLYQDFQNYPMARENSPILLQIIRFYG